MCLEFHDIYIIIHIKTLASFQKYRKPENITQLIIPVLKVTGVSTNILASVFIYEHIVRRSTNFRLILFPNKYIFFILS